MGWRCPRLTPFTRLDECPDLLFLLRGVDHTELIAGAGDAVLAQTASADPASALGDLGDIFGIELDAGAVVVVKEPVRPRSKVAKKAVKTSGKKAKKKTAKKSVKKAAKKKSRQPRRP